MKPAVVFHLNAGLQAPGNIRDKYLVGWSISSSDALPSMSVLSRSIPKGKVRDKLSALADRVVTLAASTPIQPLIYDNANVPSLIRSAVSGIYRCQLTVRLSGFLHSYLL